MNKNTFLVITSIANDNNKVLHKFAKEAAQQQVPFIVIGDIKSPENFYIKNCNFYSVEQQKELNFKLVQDLPFKHYTRKNIGYLIAMQQGAEIIIETDDDNFPTSNFWEKRNKINNAHMLENKGWVNTYKHFTNASIWPRGFALEEIQKEFPTLSAKTNVNCTIQQGLADKNPDVDAIYRLTQPLPVHFSENDSLALGNNSFCPFNSQNTTWFKEAFLLMYLPSTCSFRMTDIWRSYIAQRIAWTCGWAVLFHKSTVWQERNHHNLMVDFNDEIVGYQHANLIYESLINLDLKEGTANIASNLICCYQKLIDLHLLDTLELHLLKCWIQDVEETISNL